MHCLLALTEPLCRCSFFNPAVGPYLVKQNELLADRAAVERKELEAIAKRTADAHERLAKDLAALKEQEKALAAGANPALVADNSASGISSASSAGDSKERKAADSDLRIKTVTGKVLNVAYDKTDTVRLRA